MKTQKHDETQNFILDLENQVHIRSSNLTTKGRGNISRLWVFAANIQTFQQSVKII